MSGEKGFSLIELLIVVSMIAISSAIAYPQLNQWLPGIRVNGDVRGLAMEINLTKVRAISENRKYAIKFESSLTGPWQYKVYADMNRDRTIDTGSNSELVKTVYLSSGVRFGSASGSISKPTGGCCVPDDGITFIGGDVAFGSDGRGDGAGAAYLIPERDAVSGRSDRMRAITISSPTYRVKVYKYTGVSWVVF